jgi:hypothetical protein
MPALLLRSPGPSMNPVAIIILICSVSLSLSRSDCQPDNAIDVVVGQKADNEMLCAFLGQTTIAATELRPRDAEEYVKIMCVRSDYQTHA